MKTPAARFVALDLETTGLDSRRDEIVEFGAARLRSGAETPGADVRGRWLSR